MKRWVLAVATLAISAAAAAGAGEAAACTPKKNRNCFNTPATINFSSVPDISKQIVNQEPNEDKQTTRTLEAPPITTYTGPTVGVSSMARAPTVGYYWSLEPQADSSQAESPQGETPRSDTH